MHKVQRNLKTFTGSWKGGGELDANYNAFQSNRRALMSLEDAAWETPSGKYARRWGADKVLVNEFPGKVEPVFTFSNGAHPPKP
jgi:hypothetical protein